jgi:Flp pilus assembly protein TadG
MRRAGSNSAEAWASAGSVTAELALALPAVVLVLGALLGTGQVVGAQLRCVDAARAAARLAARGEPDGPVTAAGKRLAPGGARVEVALGAQVATVTVSTSVRLGFGVDVPVGARAVAAREVP